MYTVRPKMESCFQDRACSVSSFMGCGDSSQSPPTFICLTVLFIHPSLQDICIHITNDSIAWALLQSNQVPKNLYETMGKIRMLNIQ